MTDKTEITFVDERILDSAVRKLRTERLKRITQNTVWWCVSAFCGGAGMAIERFWS